MSIRLGKGDISPLDGPKKTPKKTVLVNLNEQAATHNRRMEGDIIRKEIVTCHWTKSGIWYQQKRPPFLPQATT
jgi:hypothetical protein